MWYTEYEKREGDVKMKERNSPARIASFSVDHDLIVPGVYISRIDGDIITYDLRTRRPNAGKYMDNVTMHTVEHLFATYIRATEIGDRVIYFGPMGCRTGFYLLVRGTGSDEVYEVILETLRQICRHTGALFGAKRRECGNYRGLSLASGQRECTAYLKLLESRKQDFAYPTEKSIK